MNDDAWHPDWIAQGGRRLYAAFHPAPMGPHTGRTGVLLVSPLLHEQPRGRRLLSQLAGRMAAHGLDALRFDFYGTGDSGGTGLEADLDSMAEDLSLATAYLRERGAERVVVLAMRGGTLPVSHWLKRGGACDAMVLWEPIVDGAAWLGELEHADACELRSRDRYPQRRGEPVPSDPEQLMGFDVSRRFRDGLSGASFSRDASMRQPTWAVLRRGVELPALQLVQRMILPDATAGFGESTRMDGAMFVSPRLQPMVDELAATLREALDAPALERIA